MHKHIHSFSLVLVLTVFCLVSLPVHSCSCGGANSFGGYGSLGPIRTLSAYSLMQDQIVVGTSLDYNNFSELSTSRLAQINSRRQHTHSFESAMRLNVNLAWGITNKLDLILNYPYNWVYGQVSTAGGQTFDEGTSYGFGDLTALLKYNFYKAQRGTLLATAIAGMKFPTGQTDMVNDLGQNFAADDQPGSGSWDPIMGLALSKVHAPFTFDTSVLYRLSTPGTNDFIVGDNITFGSGISYQVDRFLPRRLIGQDLDWSLVLELNGFWQEKVELDGLKDDNHGGFNLFVSPGVKLGINENIYSSLSVGLPLIGDLNGLQPNTNLTLLGSINFVF